MSSRDDAGKLIARLTELELLLPKFIEVETPLSPRSGRLNFGKEKEIRYDQQLSPRLVTWEEQEQSNNHVQFPQWRKWEKIQVEKRLVPAPEPCQETPPDITHPGTTEDPVQADPIQTNHVPEVIQPHQLPEVINKRQDKDIQTSIALAIDCDPEEDVFAATREKQDLLKRSYEQTSLQKCFSTWLQRWYRSLFVRVATEARMNAQGCDFYFDDEILPDEPTETKAFSSNPVITRVYRQRQRAKKNTRFNDDVVDDVLDMVLDDS